MTTVILVCRVVIIIIILIVIVVVVVILVAVIMDNVAFIPQRAGAGCFLLLPFFPTGVAEFVATHTSHMVATLREFNHVLAFDTLAPQLLPGKVL